MLLMRPRTKYVDGEMTRISSTGKVRYCGGKQRYSIISTSSCANHLAEDHCTSIRFDRKEVTIHAGNLRHLGSGSERGIYVTICSLLST